MENNTSIDMVIDEDLENNSAQAEIEEPLLHQSKILSQEDGSVSEDGTQISSKESVWMVYFSTTIAVWGSYEFGCCAGYSSPTQAATREDINLSLGEAMRTAVAFCVAGWLAIYFAEGALALDLGRLSTGYGMGVFSYVVPVFIAEMAPKNLRGRLTTLNQLMITMGVSVSFLIGALVTWRTLALIGLIPCFILIVGLFFMPESPRWLAKMGRQKEFEVALRRLRGKDADISHEPTEIQDYIKTLQSLPKANIFDLFQRRYLRSVTIRVGLMVCQQFGGINAICFYVSEVFVSAGFPSDLGTAIYACLQVVVTALGATLIDKAGRRALLLTSGTGLVIGCLLASIAFYMKANLFSLNAVPSLVLTGILVYIGSFSIAMGSVPWVVMSEIFPINIKGVAGSLATLVNWFVINALAVLFIAVLVPETKGRSLEEIQAAINKS